jgi:hypothetical protein
MRLNVFSMQELSKGLEELCHNFPVNPGFRAMNSFSSHPCRNIFPRRAFWLPSKEDPLSRLPQDKNRIERATRESQSIIAGERQAREAKTARLRAQRLSSDGPTPAHSAGSKPRTAARKSSQKIIGVD